MEKNYLKHSGRKGQKWYKRFFQSYKTKPTRSGKIGQEFGKAASSSHNKKRQLTEEQKKYIGYNRPDLLLKYKTQFTPEEINRYRNVQKDLREIKKIVDSKKTTKSQKLKKASNVMNDLSSLLESTYKSAVSISKGYKMLNNFKQKQNSANRKKDTNKKASNKKNKRSDKADIKLLEDKRMKA